MTGDPAHRMYAAGARAVRFHLCPPALEIVTLPGDTDRTTWSLSLPLYLASQLDRFLAESGRGRVTH